MRQVCDVPIVFMGYVNNVLGYGEERLAQMAEKKAAKQQLVGSSPGQ